MFRLLDAAETLWSDVESVSGRRGQHASVPTSVGTPIRKSPPANLKKIIHSRLHLHDAHPILGHSTKVLIFPAASLSLRCNLFSNHPLLPILFNDPLQESIWVAVEVAGVIEVVND